MVVYNASQVGLCGWVIYAAKKKHRPRGLSLCCNAFEHTESGMAVVLHMFYLSKVLDFFDTLFRIVKGNWRQVSFLHGYHHFTVVLYGFIHFVMYSLPTLCWMR